jgi:hypothetical protein
MKLTIYIAITRDYFIFSKILIHSLVQNFPNEKIKKIVINNIGLSQSQLSWLENSFERIEFIETTKETIETEFKIHTAEWQEAVSQKTIGLHQICEEKNYPILMLDCDMYVVKDFSNEIFEECDIQVCKRPPLSTGTGYVLNYIGCWFLVHTPLGKEFVESWIRTIPHMKGGHKETPALCSLIPTTGQRYLIKENTQDNVASLNAKKHEDERRTSKILHFKSKPHGGRHYQSLPERILNVKNIPHDIGYTITQLIKS